MAMDATKNGAIGRLTIIASVVGILVVLLGGVYNLSNSVSAVNGKLDRNCQILVTLDQDIRFHALSETGVKPAQFAPFPKASC